MARNWEGGVRVAALLAGGILPAAVRGTKLEGFIHEADCVRHVLSSGRRVAHRRHGGCCHTTATARRFPERVAAHLRDESHQSRVEWPITPVGEQVGPRALHGGDAAYMAGGYKLLVGMVRQAGWPGKLHPNVSVDWDSYATTEQCTRPEIGKIGCLFDVIADPEERIDLALSMPTKARETL